MHITWRIGIAAATLSIFAGHSATASEARCEAKSGATRVAVLELYTSEGCDSCPPADRWLSALPAAGLDLDKVVPLSLHVDYWNHLGWTDRFAQPQFTARQRAAAARNRNGFVYTPQRLLNGRDFRPSTRHDDTEKRVAEINRTAPDAEISIAIARTPTRVDADLTIRHARPGAEPEADAYLGLIESGLETVVKAGENRGKRLQHDYVVRRLIGPFALSSAREQILKRSLELRADWRTDRMSIVAFVEKRDTGEALQALALALCR